MKENFKNRHYQIQNEIKIEKLKKINDQKNFVMIKLLQ